MRSYIRKTNRGNTPQELMQAAAYAVIQGESLRKISRELGICHATLFRFIRKLKSGQTPTVGYKAKLLFTASQEQEILKHLVQFSNVFCGLTLDNIKRLSCDLAKLWKYTIPESWLKNNTASKDWADKFVKRHSFPVKQLKGTSNVNNFFNMLHKLIEEHKFLPARIYYLEEIAIPLVKNRRVLPCKSPVYMELAFNTSGETLAPMLMINPDEYGLKDETHLCIGSTGTMNATYFLRFLTHVVDHTKPCKERPVLLILDSNKYVDINVLKKADQSCIMLLSLPEHVDTEKPFVKLAKYVKKFNKYRELTLKPESYDVLDLVSAVMPTKFELVKCFRKNGVWPFNPSAVTGEDFVPGIVDFDYKVSEQPALQAPGPSNARDPKTSDANISQEPQDPLSKGTIEQCRFCGDFSKQCVPVSDRPYLSTNRTTLAFNDMIVEIDFNDKTLPNTLCKNCDAKLQEMFDFVKVVKNAQQSLINIAAEQTEVNVQFEPGEIETVVIKTECEDSQDSNDENDGHGKDGEEDQDESKDGIVNSITIGKTVFIKEAAAPKRKRHTIVKMPKKAKVTEIEENELIIDIKEEVIEKDETNDEGMDTGVTVSDTRTDDKPSESELAANALVHVMGSDGDGSWTKYK